MRNAWTRMAGAVLVCGLAASAQGIVVGQALPGVEIADRGMSVPTTRVVNGRIELADRELRHQPWHPRMMLGRVWTLYHLAARSGADEINKAYIDALIAAKLPEFAPDAPYRTVTVLNLADALWGTGGIARSRLDKSQRELPYAFHVEDEKGLGRAAWGLQPKSSAVAVMDRDGTVLFAKDGKLSPEEITRAVSIIKERLGMK